MLAAVAAGLLTLAAPEPGTGQLPAYPFGSDLRLSAPSYASDQSRSTRFRISWTGAGSDVAEYRLEVRRNTNVATRWRVVTAGTTRTSTTFRGRPGIAYQFRLRARDRSGNSSGYVYDETIVPLDDRSRRIAFGPGWRRIERRGAYGRTIARARRAGLEARVRFRGSRVALIARRSPRGARLVVTVGARRRAISLRGPDRFRRVVFRSRELRPGRHLLRLRTLDGGIADLDGIGVDTGPSPPRR